MKWCRAKWPESAWGYLVYWFWLTVPHRPKPYHHPPLIRAFGDEGYYTCDRCGRVCVGPK